jgi:hypothetical protein
MTANRRAIFGGVPCPPFGLSTGLSARRGQIVAPPTADYVLAPVKGVTGAQMPHFDRCWTLAVGFFRVRHEILSVVSNGSVCFGTRLETFRKKDSLRFFPAVDVVIVPSMRLQLFVIIRLRLFV